jgi:hypothetical protein
VAGKNVRGHSARRAGTDDDGIVGFRQIYFRLRHERILLAPNGLKSLALPLRPKRSVDYAKRSTPRAAKDEQGRRHSTMDGVLCPAQHDARRSLSLVTGFLRGVAAGKCVELREGVAIRKLERIRAFVVAFVRHANY